MINLALLVGVAALVLFVIVPNWRRYAFRLTGKVTVDGSTFYLQPTDNFLTPLVLNTGEYEPTETRLVRETLKEGDVFIDVGANVGWYTVFAARAVGPSGQVVAFEPEPSNLDLLNRNVRLNRLTNVVVEGKGLSNAAGSFKLFLERGNLGMHSLVVEHEGRQYIDVETVRFDDYWKGQGDIKLVKIDTEGAEAMILEGMGETLRRHKGLELIVEFAPERWRKSGYDPDKVLEGLYQLGFKASVIDEDARRVVPLGTPLAKEFPFARNQPYCNLHLKR
jgi:FkbM family methyltransferase